MVSRNLSKLQTRILDFHFHLCCAVNFTPVQSKKHKNKEKRIFNSFITAITFVQIPILLSAQICGI